MDYLLERKRQDPLDFLQPIKVAQNALLSSQPFHNLDINTLLHQTGYLNIRAVEQMVDWCWVFPIEKWNRPLRISIVS